MDAMVVAEVEQRNTKDFSTHYWHFQEFSKRWWHNAALTRTVLLPKDSTGSGQI